MKLYLELASPTNRNRSADMELLNIEDTRDMSRQINELGDTLQWITFTQKT